MEIHTVEEAMTTITIQLDSNVEQQLREKARLRGQTLEVYLQQLAEDDAQTANGAAMPAAPQTSEAESAHQWCQRLRAWAANHPTLPFVADDSRESIYEGRGE
jgi:hypothetical protein